MLLFNEAISALGLVELPLYGRKFTWSNKQQSPLLERLDWFFYSISWTNNFSGTSVSTLTMETSDHVPCLVSVTTDIPKGLVFRFENYWMQHENFLQIVQHGWSIPVHHSGAAKRITAKFKNLRRVLRSWQSQLSSLKANIQNVKLILSFMGLLEEFRDLSMQEWNFRSILQDRLIHLLKQQRTYWKQRGNIRWVTTGDAGSKFFHAHATIRHKKKFITFLEDQNGTHQSNHSIKATLLWESYKERLGQSEFQANATRFKFSLTGFRRFGLPRSPFHSSEN